jgi:hypothetical protein
MFRDGWCGLLLDQACSSEVVDTEARISPNGAAIQADVLQVDEAAIIALDTFCLLCAAAGLYKMAIGSSRWTGRHFQLTERHALGTEKGAVQGDGVAHDHRVGARTVVPYRYDQTF